MAKKDPTAMPAMAPLESEGVLELVVSRRWGGRGSCSFRLGRATGAGCPVKTVSKAARTGHVSFLLVPFWAPQPRCAQADPGLEPTACDVSPAPPLAHTKEALRELSLCFWFPAGGDPEVDRQGEGEGGEQEEYEG